MNQKRIHHINHLVQTRFLGLGVEARVETPKTNYDRR
jgi:hypothetical protein